VRTRAEFVNREYVNWWLLYHLLITCVPSPPSCRPLRASCTGDLALCRHTLLIAAVGLRLIRITPHLEQAIICAFGSVGDAVIVSSLAAIALSFVNSQWRCGRWR